MVHDWYIEVRTRCDRGRRRRGERTEGDRGRPALVVWWSQSHPQWENLQTQSLSYDMTIYTRASRVPGLSPSGSMADIYS